MPLSLLGAVVGSLVPSSVMGWLRVAVPGFALVWDWLDASLPWINPLHVIAYAWIALLLRVLWPRASWWRVPVGLAVLGTVCEWLQHYIPTRQPRVTDVLSDVLGIAIGWGVAVVIHRARRQAG